MSMPLLKAKLKAEMDKSAQDRNNALEAESKTRTRLIALRAVKGDLDQLDLDNLDALGRITGTLKNTYIESLSAAKITSATMLATTLTLAGTEASNNKTSLVMMGDALLRVNDGFADRLRISNSGLELSTSSETADPAAIPGQGISMLGASAIRIWPYSNSSRRGWQMRADGVGGGAQGRLTFVSTRHPAALPTDTTSYANAILQSEALSSINFTGASGLSVRNALSVIGWLRASGGIEADGSVYSGGAMFSGAGIIAQGSLQTKSGAIVSGEAGVATPLVLAVSGSRVDVKGALQTDSHLRVGGTYENTGNTAVFGGGIRLGGSLDPNGNRINAAEYGSLTNVAAGATVTLSYGGNSDPLWVDVRWRVDSTANWRPSTASLATTGVNVNSWAANGVSVTNHTGVTRQVQAIFWA
jgi:hypothetical protein